MSRLLAVLLIACLATASLANESTKSFSNRKMLVGGLSGSFASADAAASTFIESFKKGHGRGPSFSECQAAASANSAAFGDGAFSFADVAAEAASRSLGWKGKFLSECSAKASATSFSAGDGFSAADASAEAATIGNGGGSAAAAGAKASAIGSGGVSHASADAGTFTDGGSSVSFAKASASSQSGFGK